MPKKAPPPATKRPSKPIPKGTNRYTHIPRTPLGLSEEIRQMLISGLSQIEGSMIEGYLMRVENGWITVYEASVLINQAPNVVLSLIRQGELEAFYRSHSYLVRHASIKSYLERHISIAPGRKQSTQAA